MEYAAHESIPNSKTPFYNLFIFIVIFISSLSLPFRFQSFGTKFTNFLDTNDRHYIFLFCNCILILIFLDSSTNQLGPKARMLECDKITVASGDSMNVHVHNEHVSAIEVEQKEQSVTVSGVDDHHDDRIEDQETETETEMDLDVDDDEHEMLEDVAVKEEEHHDQEEAKVFQQKCEEFIKKVRQSMHHEGCPVTMIDFQELVD